MPPLSDADAAALVARLNDLGFRFVSKPLLEFGLREFQTYASAPKVAQFKAGAGTYSDQLTSVENTDRFTGPPHGAADDRTLKLIELWTTNSWRCPVVIEAWWTKRIEIDDPSGTKDPKGKKVFKITWRKRERVFADPGAENLWLWNEGPQLLDKTNKKNPVDREVRMYARDFSGRFAGNPRFDALVAADDRILLGRHTVDKARNFNGPLSDPKSGEVRERVTATSFTGVDYKNMTTAYARSRFRVARAVASVECKGFFDALNAYDRAHMSLGPCHWTLGQINGNKLSRGELEASIAYLRHLNSVDFDAATSPFGYEPFDAWYPKDAAETPPIANSSQRKYNTFPAYYEWNEPAKKAERKQLPASEDRLNFLRSWHWFYRFQIATRIAPQTHAAMWDLIRFRIRDVRAVEIPKELGIPANSANAPLTLGDLFTSEQAAALLLQIHIWKPARIVTDKSLSESMVKAIKLAGQKGVNLKSAPKSWKNKDQKLLIEAVLKVMPSGARKRQETAIQDKELRIYPLTGRWSLSPVAKSYPTFSDQHAEDPALYPPPPWEK